MKIRSALLEMFRVYRRTDKANLTGYVCERLNLLKNECNFLRPEHDQLRSLDCNITTYRACSVTRQTHWSVVRVCVHARRRSGTRSPSVSQRVPNESQHTLPEHATYEYFKILEVTKGHFR
jgi:hypothetical protein